MFHAITFLVCSMIFGFILIKPTNEVKEFKMAILIFMGVGFLFAIILTLEHLGILPLFKD